MKKISSEVHQSREMGVCDAALIGFGAFMLTLSVSMILLVISSRDNFRNFFNRDRKNQP